MKRHMDLIREILLAAEEQDEQWFAKMLELEGWEQCDIVYNVGLAIDAGFLEAEDASLLGHDGKDFVVEKLTFQGHDFLDQIRDESVWKKVKSIAAEKGVDLTVDVVKSLAAKIVESLLG